MQTEKRAQDRKPPETSGSFNLREWLALCAEHYSKEISGLNAKLYERALAGLLPTELEAACSRALQTCRFMPTIADILAKIEKDRKLLENSSCDAEWADLLGKIWAWDNYYNTWGCDGPPSLSAAGHYAVRCCGGLATVQATKVAHLPLLKKSFEEYYQRHSEKERFLLTPGATQKLLADIERNQQVGALAKENA